MITRVLKVEGTPEQIEAIDKLIDSFTVKSTETKEEPEWEITKFKDIQINASYYGENGIFVIPNSAGYWGWEKYAGSGGSTLEKMLKAVKEGRFEIYEVKRKDGQIFKIGDNVYTRIRGTLPDIITKFTIASGFVNGLGVSFDKDTDSGIGAISHVTKRELICYSEDGNKPIYEDDKTWWVYIPVFGRAGYWSLTVCKSHKHLLEEYTECKVFTTEEAAKKWVDAENEKREKAKKIQRALREKRLSLQDLIDQQIEWGEPYTDDFIRFLEEKYIKL